MRKACGSTFSRNHSLAKLGTEYFARPFTRSCLHRLQSRIPAQLRLLDESSRMGLLADTITKKPASDKRHYRFVSLQNGVRGVVVQDPEAVFAAACVNVQTGYFDDPIDTPGVAHYLEHAVHLGSQKYPDVKEYKFWLSQHGGVSNASTSMVHTQYHFKVHSDHVQGAIDRLGQFFVAPLLTVEAVLPEVENVHSEFVRNCASDDRLLMQLKRSLCLPPYSKFSTGNISTLRDAPSQAGVDVVALLRSHWHAHYTGDKICVAVVGPQDPLLLEEWLLASFAGVRPAGIGGMQTPDHPNGNADHQAWRERLVVCGQEQRGLMVEVAPSRDLRKLELQWHLPYGPLKHSQCKPWKWVSHLLGHESQGSVAHHLKRAGLIQSLSAGLGEEVRLGEGFMFFAVDISLTEAGLQAVPAVLQAVFHGIRVLLDTSDEQRRKVWEELQRVVELRFDYQDREEPRELSKTLAQRLHYYPPAQLLTGPVLLEQYSGESLASFLSYLTPSNLNVIFSSRQFSGSTQLVERWYGAKYNLRPLQQDLLDQLTAIHEGRAPGLDLHPPAPNWALPSHVSLAAGQPEAGTWETPPELIMDHSNLRAWYRPDTSFAIPKVHVHVHLVTPQVYQSPRSLAATKLLMRVLEDVLLPEAYHADLVATSYSLTSHETGLTLYVRGFSEVVPRLMRLVLTTLLGLSLEQVEQRFDVMTGKLRQALSVWQHSAPIELAEADAHHLLQEPHWHNDQILAALQGLHAADVLALARALTRQMYTEVLLYGSIERSAATTIVQELGNLLAAGPLPVACWPGPRVVRVGGAAALAGRGERSVVCHSSYAINPTNRNHATLYLLQVGEDMVADGVLLDLFVAIAKKPAFHQLRTLERLGYSVSCHVMRIQRTINLAVRIQSADHKPGALDARITAWLVSFRGFLEGLDAEAFAAHLTSLAHGYMEPCTSLEDASSRCWSKIRHRTYDFAKRRSKTEFLQGVTMQQLLEFYDTQLAPGAARERRVTCHVLPHPKHMPPTTCPTPTSPTHTQPNTGKPSRLRDVGAGAEESGITPPQQLHEQQGALADGSRCTAAAEQQAGTDVPLSREQAAVFRSSQQLFPVLSLYASTHVRVHSDVGSEGGPVASQI